MLRITAVVMVFWAAIVMVGPVAWGVAGAAEKPYRIREQRQAPVKQYEGQIKAIKIDKCGLQPGTCEGSIILAKKGGGEVVLRIGPGTWIRRGDNFVLIDELGVGNYVNVRAVALAPEKEERITLMEANVP
jgi:hypothetical protein